jgi:hypothetical protein
MASAVVCNSPVTSSAPFASSEQDNRLVDAFLARIPTAHLDQQRIKVLRRAGLRALEHCRLQHPALQPSVVRYHVRAVLLQALSAL